jgi:pre-mRNA-splicing factor ATP-dependent RNA helicase DHX16
MTEEERFWQMKEQ